MLVCHRVNPALNLLVPINIQMYTWMENGTVRVTCLVQEQETVTSARTQAQTVQSRDQSTENYYATAASSHRAGVGPDAGLSHFTILKTQGLGLRLTTTFCKIP